MEIKLKSKILKELSLAMPWYNDIFLNSVLNEIIANPEITKEELAWISVRGVDRKKPITIANEYIAGKFIKIAKEDIDY